MSFNRYYLLNIGIKSILPVCAKWNPSMKIKEKFGSFYHDRQLFSLENLLPNMELDLSIVIPVYNAEKYIRQCLTSIENQNTKYQYEVILVDDGSTDTSSAILKEYAEKNSIFRIITQKNQGISAARNAGIQNARGKYIGFIDNDDFVEPDYCETLLRLAYKNNADIVKCGHIRYDIEKNKKAATITSKSVCIKGEIGNAITNYKGFIWGGLYNREIFSDIRFPLNFWYEDMIGRLLLMRKSKTFVFESRPLYYYALHSDNASKKVWKKGQIKSLDQLYLAELLTKYGQKIGLGKKNGLYRILLVELGPILWMRTRGLKQEICQGAFLEAAKFISEYKDDRLKKTVYEKYIEQAFEKRNYFLWKAVSICYICEIKAQNVI